MLEAELSQLVQGPISVATWNHNRSCVALSMGNEEILVYTSSSSGQWTLQHTLREHDQRITGLDWYSTGDGLDKLLSCSADRNAYVWTVTSEGTWQPSLVLLRFKRAATCAEWSADGKKFAVGGSEGLVAIGHYDKDNDWWVCKHLKKVVEGPILSLSWHASGLAIAVGTLKGNVHVVSAYLEGIDQQKSATWLDEATAKSWDSECFTVQVGHWIHAVAWSPSGNALAWTNADAITTIYYPGSGYQSSVEHLTDGVPIPFKRLFFLDGSSLVAVGHSSIPVVLSGSDGKPWKVQAELKDAKTATGPALASDSKQSDTAKAFGGAFAKFKMMDQQGLSNSPKAKASTAKHVSAITDLKIFQQAGKSTKMATVGLDGRLIIWSLDPIVAQVGIATL